MDELLPEYSRSGKVFGYDPQLPPGADYPYHQVTEADIWSDDPRSPNYNRHIVIDPKNPPDNYTARKNALGRFRLSLAHRNSAQFRSANPRSRQRDFLSIFGVALTGRPLAVPQWRRQIL